MFAKVIEEGAGGVPNSLVNTHDKPTLKTEKTDMLYSVGVVKCKRMLHGFNKRPVSQ